MSLMLILEKRSYLLFVFAFLALAHDYFAFVIISNSPNSTFFKLLHFCFFTHIKHMSFIGLMLLFSVEGGFPFYLCY